MNSALLSICAPRRTESVGPNVEAVINGQAVSFPAGMSILDALHATGVTVPTLCHDERLAPVGACRMCLVAVDDGARLMPACHTPLSAGMKIETHTPELEAMRREILWLLTRDYPTEAVAQFPEKPFHHWLRHYGVIPGACEKPERFRDSTHPYLHVDMRQCIECFRCVRICAEVQGQFVWHALGRGADTLIYPDKGATLLDSSCVSCGACVDACPTGALEDQSVLAHGSPVAWTRTTCPYCGTGCEMHVGTRDGRIVQVRPVLDAPVNKGHLCVKGRYAFAFVHAPDRVTEPMIRVGGEWRKVSWDDAIAFTAHSLAEIRERHGPDSIGVLGSARGTNEENYLAQKFARVVLGTNNVDCCARVCHAPTAAGMKQTLGTGAATNSFDDIERAAGFVICGCNPTENHPIVGARIKQAVLRGVRLIVIDPRQTELTPLAAVHLALRPGTNVPLLNALAHVIVAEEMFDAAMVRERVADFDAFREFIREWTPERAATICGVEATLIREAARVYATAKPAMFFHGLGMTEHVQGTEGVMCLVNLALLTGNLGIPGAGVNPLRGQNNVQGSAHMGCEPGNLTGYVGLDQGRASFEQVWGARVPTAPGLNLMQMVDAAGAGQLKALWAIGYDVALTNPQAAETRRALGALDLVIVQDVFVNELARQCGTVFLPACSSFEREGTFMNSERRVQRVRAALPPIGQSRADWQIICDVASAMGHGSQFAFHSAKEIWDEVRAVWPAGRGLSYERLEPHGLQWPCPDENHPGTAILHTAEFTIGKRAPLRRVDFTPTAEAPTADFPFLLTTGRTLYQFNAGTMTQRTRNAELRESDTLDIAPCDAAQLGLRDRDRVRVRSRHGEAVLPLRMSDAVKPGELFATFHTVEVFLNKLTSGQRDHVVQTPEYKIVAVCVEKVGPETSQAASP